LIQGVDVVYDAVDTEESDSAQIQEKGGAETNTDLISEEEEDMMSPKVPTKAPIDPTTASGTINGAYITYSAQHNNIHRSHQIAFPEEEGGFMMQKKHMSTISTTTTTMTASGTINGVYISSPIQHNNILRSHHLFSQLQMMMTMMWIMHILIMTSSVCMNPYKHCQIHLCL
jgi:hypothetical protein